jgi:hypothetical protein
MIAVARQQFINCVAHSGPYNFIQQVVMRRRSQGAAMVFAPIAAIGADPRDASQSRVARGAEFFQFRERRR